MRIAVFDDDRNDQEQMLQALREWDPAAEAECYSDADSLLDAVKQEPAFDIAFLDIYTPDRNGLEIARALRESSPRTGIVFVTVSREHALDAFALYALHYLLKPVTAEGIRESFARLKERWPERKETITFTVGRSRRIVAMDQICYLVSDNHAVVVTLTDGKQFRVWTTFRGIEQKLPRNFLRINRGIVVNMDCVEEMRTESCVMQTGKELYLAVRERGSIFATYQDYQLDRLARMDQEGNH